ncbi:MAG: metal-dependent phosphohydrolase [Propionicimonas sp.]|nr:metal-dependent phosphohydrolase [Propionicimonas sp.]MEA5116580.1 metal-dependent phosphohydrolase [Propionicimonas sp.]
MADRPVVNPPTQPDRLRAQWQTLLPGQPELGEELLRRWSEPHRHYHGLEHLADALGALTLLCPANRAESLAVWFHDAVHTGTAGPDEQHSSELAASSLRDAGLPPAEITEVARLVLVTIAHSPAPHDHAGARVSDADLAVLGADAERYAASVAQLRQESLLDDAGWRTARLTRLESLLATPRLFHTVVGHKRWEAAARANLTAERDDLLAR